MGSGKENRSFTAADDPLLNGLIPRTSSRRRMGSGDNGSGCCPARSRMIIPIPKRVGLQLDQPVATCRNTNLLNVSNMIPEATDSHVATISGPMLGACGHFPCYGWVGGSRFIVHGGCSEELVA